MKLLLTAFEPFGGLDTNVSLEVFHRIEGEDIVKQILPVSYTRCPLALKEAIEKVRPDGVLCLGQAGGSRGVQVEKLGINYTRGAIADNDGDLRLQGELVPQAPAAIFTRFPAEAIQEKVNSLTPTSLSLSAGGYVCNCCYYHALRLTEGKALFIHLPYYEGQGEKLTPCVPLDKLTEGVKTVIDRLRGLIP